ncbi:SMC-Scp complex subunit ScpB [Patescibacteria group bacterium]|nr:SMC-Scp complex subunit ScpB [Patescibacteria group bacterium]MBU1759144.1 SMC-Scp complex subunit ScpB [Patescibacteria group bacterium]MBU1907495.1 SMC-Scp complex subunit ScpB [Patescibacteria group bacterium]
MSVVSKIESILFVATRPLEPKQIGKMIDAKPAEVREALEELMKTCNTEGSGLHLIEQDGKYQMVTAPANAGAVESLVKEEVAGELSRPSLETLTIIAYRGPITKPEIEQIRGINCSMILRNLLMRGLILEEDDADRLQPIYKLSTDFIRHLGIHSVEELPKYDELKADESIEEVLGEAEAALPMEGVAGSRQENAGGKETDENVKV